MTIKPEDIRTAQFIDTFYPIVDGVVQVVDNYAAILNRQTYACVVTPKPLKKDYDDSALPYDVYRTSTIKLPVAEYSIPAPRLDAKLKEFIREKNVDILHAHSPFYEGSFASSFAKKLNVPTVATFHSKYYDDVLNITGSKALARLITNKIVRFYRSVDSVWTVSQGAADTLRSYGFAGDIRIMRNGTSFTAPGNREELRRRACEEFSIPQDKKVLLYVGHLIKHKNLKLILDTFRMLNDRSDEYRLLIVGDGYDEKEIRGYADGLHFSEGFVRFLGKITNRELLLGVYLSADLFFFPSVYDTSGLVVREAAAMGVPSLLTEGSNAAEAVEKDVSGFIAAENKVAMYREILRIFGTEGLLQRAGEGARRDIARTWEEIIPQVREGYAEVIEKYEFEQKKKNAELIAKKEALRAKREAIREKKEASQSERQEALRVRKEAQREKKDAIREKKAAQSDKQEALRIRKEAQIEKQEALRIRKEAMIEKKEAMRAKREELRRKREEQRIKRAENKES